MELSVHKDDGKLVVYKIPYFEYYTLERAQQKLGLCSLETIWYAKGYKSDWKKLRAYVSSGKTLAVLAESD